MVSLTLILTTIIAIVSAIPVPEPQLDQILGLAGLGGANAGKKGAAGAGGLAGGLGGGAGGLLDGVLKQAGVDSPIDLSVLDNPAGALGAGGAAPVATNNPFANAKKP